MLHGTSLMSCTETTQQARWRRSGHFILLEMGRWWCGQLTESSGNLDPVAKCCVTTPKASSMSFLAINLWSHAVAMCLITARWNRALSQNGTWCVRRNGLPRLHSLPLCWESWLVHCCLEMSLIGMLDCAGTSPKKESGLDELCKSFVIVLCCVLHLEQYTKTLVCFRSLLLNKHSTQRDVPDSSRTLASNLYTGHRLVLLEFSCLSLLGVGELATLNCPLTWLCSTQGVFLHHDQCYYALVHYVLLTGSLRSKSQFQINMNGMSRHIVKSVKTHNDIMWQI